MIDGQTAFILGGSAATLLAIGGVWLSIKAPNPAARFRARLMVGAALVIAFNVWVNTLPLPAPPPSPAGATRR